MNIKEKKDKSLKKKERDSTLISLEDTTEVFLRKEKAVLEEMLGELQDNSITPNYITLKTIPLQIHNLLLQKMLWPLNITNRVKFLFRTKRRNY